MLNSNVFETTAFYRGKCPRDPGDLPGHFLSMNSLKISISLNIKSITVCYNERGVSAVGVHYNSAISVK